jgi:hypothetical protein
VSPRKNSGGPSRGSAGGGGRSGSGKYGRPTPDPDDLGRAFGYQHTESDGRGDWIVRQVTGAAANKTYRCPGCDHEIPPGTPHLVAWPSVPEYGSGGGVGERRHWHTACWNARGRRRPR